MNDNITTTADPHEVAGTISKQQPGRAGHNGQQHLRTRRVETRVSPAEHATICARALSQGFGSIAQYVRQQAVHGGNADSPFSHHHILLACQAELNDIAGHVNQIARHLTEGEALDEEMLMVMMQVLDLAEENLKRITKESTAATAGTAEAA
ncbi:plasmid mobilization protein [Variovorax paradoxus]|uniref:plasmid mobilization protein n=1 Tax=Variovorax paradoxus TaxID=34073 RepID=UPI0005ACC1D6|nr:hypothetical protein [Variovorax paradoxus]